MNRRTHRRGWLAVLLTGALFAALPATMADAQPQTAPAQTTAAGLTPVDPTIPTPTQAEPYPGVRPAGADGCGSDSVGWVNSNMFDVTLPASTVPGVNFQSAVHIWDLDGSQQANGAGGSIVSVPFDVENGHTYGWYAATFNGTAYSQPTATCYFKVDTGSPTSPVISNPDFPPVGGSGLPTKIAGQATTFSISSSQDSLPSGCTAAGTMDCAVSGVNRYAYSLDQPMATDGAATTPADSNGDGSVTVTPSWGVHILYVEAVDAAGNISWQTSYEFYVPFCAPTYVNLNAPAASGRATRLTVTGQLTTPTDGMGTFPANEVVQVSRTDPADPAGVAVGDAKVSASGAFSFTDTPQIGGANTYTVSYPGDGSYSESSGSATVQVSRAAPALTVTTNASTYGYGTWAEITAHLGTTYNGRAVTIYVQPAEGYRVGIVTGNVDKNGNLTAWFKLTHTTWVSAVFAGDYRYAPAGTGHYVYDQVAVQEAQSGYYATLSGTAYRVYHHTVRPTVSATVTPGKAGECVDFTVQEYSASAWRNVLAPGCEKLNSSSTAVDTLTLGNATGHLFRFIAEYVHSPADSSNVNTYGPWQYFTVKN